MFWIITKWMKITEKQICEDQIVTFKQSHILLYQGLLFLTRSTCVIVDARSHTCKSHDFILRYDIIYLIYYRNCVSLILEVPRYFTRWPVCRKSSTSCIIRNLWGSVNISWRTLDLSTSVYLESGVHKFIVIMGSLVMFHKLLRRQIFNCSRKLY